MTLGVRAIVENAAGEVLLVRHTYMPGLYFPGGCVEKAEPAHEAMARELVEEAGVQLASAAELIGVFSNHAIMRNDHVLLYRVHLWESVTATSHGEIAEIVWADPLNPPTDTTPATCRRLAELYGETAQSRYW